MMHISSKTVKQVKQDLLVEDVSTLASAPSQWDPPTAPVASLGSENPSVCWRECCLVLGR